MDFLLTSLSFFGLAFLIGLKHGFDIDHLAAISDITSSQITPRKGFFYAIYYGIGHGLAVLLFGLGIIFLGNYIPESVDRFFRFIVGITLILLGIYVLISLVKSNKNFKMKSRWMIIFSAINLARHRLLHRLKLEHDHPRFKEEQYSGVASFVVGMVHGVGAETPTQAIVLSTLFGVGNQLQAFLFLISFIVGIFIANISIAFLSSYGYLRAQKNHMLHIVVGTLTAVFSLIVGTVFLLGK